MRKRIITAIAVAVAVLATAGTVVAQSTHRFPDVPPNHEAYEAVEWAAEVGVTTGYGDGTFKPEQPLSRRHAVVFMERFYDDILGADGDNHFTSDSFTRADMMMLLKAINDDTPPSTSKQEPAPEPETDARWLPRPEGRTAEGRCAHSIDDDIYGWEDCAWGAADDPEMGRAEMQALAERVWAETSARGKPADPPTLTEGRCAELLAAACYLPSTHTISIESGVTLRSLLHELAHALITGDAVMAACYADWTSVVPHCAHGALFRCAADALYFRYASIKTAGVCGDVPDLGDWTRSIGDSRAGSYVEWRTDAYKTRREGVALVLRCTNATDLEAYAFPLRLRYFYATGIVEYRFAGQSQPQRLSATAADGPGTDGIPGAYGDALHISGTDRDRLLADIAAHETERLHIALIDVNYDETLETEAEAVLRVTGYREHVLTHVEACTSG